MAAKSTMWHDVFRLKYAQIRPENSFWCLPAFQLKIFVKPSGDHYAQDQAKMTKFTYFQILLNFVLRLFLNLNYKYWAYFSLNTSCHVVFLASTRLITIISLKIKVWVILNLQYFLFYVQIWKMKMQVSRITTLDQEIGFTIRYMCLKIHNCSP